MATTIEVNGMKIRVDNKTASKESSVMEIFDQEDLRAQAAEAYATSEIMCRTYESMNVMSTEAAGGKFVAGVKKVLTAIADFFKKIAAYVTSFITGNVIMAKAKAVAKKATELKAKNAPFPDSKVVKVKYTSVGHVEEVIAMAKEMTEAVKGNKIIDNAKLEKLAKEVNKESTEVGVSRWFKSWDDVIAVCTNNQKGVVGAMVSMKTGKVSETAKRNADFTVKLAASAGQSDGEAHVDEEIKILQSKQKATNLAVKGYTTAINCALSVAAAACSAAGKVSNDKADVPAVAK